MRLITTFFLLLWSLVVSAEGLQSKLTQGGIFIGHASPGSRIVYGGRDVRVANDGRFVLGFGHDAELEQSYIEHFSSGEIKTHRLTLIGRSYDIQRLTGIAKKYVSPAESVMSRIRNDVKRIQVARAQDTDQDDFFHGFGWPVKGRISGVYGSQRVYNGKPGRPHYGLDIAVPTGTPVAAPADGVVCLADGDLYYSGGTIIIDHGHGLFSSFLHLSKVAVYEGETIKRGQVIGEVGATGRVTGAHLDWRYNWFDQRLDPALLTSP